MVDSTVAPITQNVNLLPAVYNNPYLAAAEKVDIKLWYCGRKRGKRFAHKSHASLDHAWSKSQIQPRMYVLCKKSTPYSLK